MKQVLVREAAEGDLDDILALFVELERAQAHFRTFPKAPDAQERIVASFRRALASDDECFYVTHAPDGTVTGMAHVRIEHPSKLSDAKVVEIGRVAVHPSARGSGAGTALVAAAREFARNRGIDSLLAKVFAGNEASLEFWRALGFEPFVEQLVARDP